VLLFISAKKEKNQAIGEKMPNFGLIKKPDLITWIFCGSRTPFAAIANSVTFSG